MIMNFINTIKMASGKYQRKLEVEAEAQKEPFRKECPSLTRKREEAIAYLGDRWILAKQSKRLSEKRWG